MGFEPRTFRAFRTKADALAPLGYGRPLGGAVWPAKLYPFYTRTPTLTSCARI
jgi:hypothetical protein